MDFALAKKCGANNLISPHDGGCAVICQVLFPTPLSGGLYEEHDSQMNGKSAYTYG
jgi:hypothetical protein